MNLFLKVSLVATAFFISAAFRPVFSETLTIAWPVNAGPLNPHMYAPNQMYAQVLVYEPLVRYGADGKAKPAVADAWTVSADGKTYDFHIRPGAVFSDGTPLDAYAVEKNFRAVMANGPRHAWLGITEKIESFRAVDKENFRLTLNSPYPAALADLALPRPFRILSPSAFASDNTSAGIKAPVGSGPWKLESSRLGEYDSFVKNAYYPENTGGFDRIMVKVLPDPNARALALRTGSVDMLVGRGVVSLENFVRLGEDPRFAAVSSSPQSTNLIVLNAGSVFLGDPRTRSAVARGINKKAVIEGVLLNVEPEAGYLFRPDLPYCLVDSPVAAYDPTAAAKLFNEAGWEKKGRFLRKDGRVLALKLVYIGTDPRQKAIGEVIQGDLAKLGVRLDLEAREEVSFYQAQKNGDFDLIFNGTWGAPFDPHAFLSSMRAPSHADYAAQKNLPFKKEIDAAINDLLSAPDEKALKEAYSRALAFLHESGIYLPVSYSVMTAVYDKNKLGNFEFGAMETEFMFHKMKPAANK